MRRAIAAAAFCAADSGGDAAGVEPADGATDGGAELWILSRVELVRPRFAMATHGKYYEKDGACRPATRDEGLYASAVHVGG